MDLFCKLTGWSDDESTHRPQWTYAQPLEDWEHEAGSLTCSGLGQT